MKHLFQGIAQLALFLGLIFKSRLDAYTNKGTLGARRWAVGYWIGVLVVAAVGVGLPLLDWNQESAEDRVKHGLDAADAGRVAFNAALKEESPLNGIESSLRSLDEGYDLLKDAALVPRYRLIGVLNDLAFAHERLAYGKATSGCKYSLDETKKVLSCRKPEGPKMYLTPPTLGNDVIKCTDIDPQNMGLWEKAAGYYELIRANLKAQPPSADEVGAPELAAAARNTAYFLLCQQLRLGKDHSGDALELLSMIQRVTQKEMPSRYDDATAKILLVRSLQQSPISERMACGATCPEATVGNRYTEWSGDALGAFASRGAYFDGSSQTIPACASSREGEVVSPEVTIPSGFGEIVASWYAETPPGTSVEILVAARMAASWTKFYSLGTWAKEQKLRRSIPNQGDDDGGVDSDTLQLKKLARAFKVKVRLNGAGARAPSLFRVGVTASNPDERVACSAARPSGVEDIDVPQVSQRDFQDGRDRWCSPTSVGMMLGYWSEELDDPTLKIAVPAIAAGVLDSASGKAGNWSFNVAFVNSVSKGSLRAFVVRLLGTRQLEALIKADVPVTVSAHWESKQLSGAPIDRTAGHLFVVRGFDTEGNILVNDPAAPKESVARKYKLGEFDAAWKNAKRTAYVFLPAGRPIPQEIQGCPPDNAREPMTAQP